MRTPATRNCGLRVLAGHRSPIRGPLGSALGQNAPGICPIKRDARRVILGLVVTVAAQVVEFEVLQLVWIDRRSLRRQK